MKAGSAGFAATLGALLGAMPAIAPADTEAHEIFLLWWYRTVPYRSYVKGWKISPSHYLNQDLATVWLDK
jgi:hypothetical protein